MATKRRPPPVLQQILEFDVALTRKFTLLANKFLPLRSLRIHYKMLEISCHGIPWLAFWIAFSWLFNVPSLVPMQINMLLGLILDIIFVGLIKAYVRRRRPVSNSDDRLGQIGPDKFSFPSGHTSRAVLVTYFFLYLHPLPIFLIPPFLAWTTAVAISRILLQRHYILDILGGVCLGLFEGLLLGLIWLSDDTANWLVGAISDEKWSGGEYHV